MAMPSPMATILKLLLEALSFSHICEMPQHWSSLTMKARMMRHGAIVYLMEHSQRVIIGNLSESKGRLFI